MRSDELLAEQIQKRLEGSQLSCFAHADASRTDPIAIDSTHCCMQIEKVKSISWRLTLPPQTAESATSMECLSWTHQFTLQLPVLLQSGQQSARRRESDAKAHAFHNAPRDGPLTLLSFAQQQHFQAWRSDPFAAQGCGPNQVRRGAVMPLSARGVAACKA